MYTKVFFAILTPFKRETQRVLCPWLLVNSVKGTHCKSGILLMHGGLLKLFLHSICDLRTSKFVQGNIGQRNILP